jgi:excisionase family DNA binding protein
MEYCEYFRNVLPTNGNYCNKSEVLMADEVLTVKEVADYLKISRTTVWRWCNDGKLSAFKVGRGWRVRRIVVERLTKDNEQPEEKE